MLTLYEAALEVERRADLMRELGTRATAIDMREYRRAIKRFDILCGQRDEEDSDPNTLSPAKAARVRRMLRAIRTVEDTHGRV